MDDDLNLPDNSRVDRFFKGGTTSGFGSLISVASYSYNNLDQKVYIIVLANKSGFPSKAESILEKMVELGN